MRLFTNVEPLFSTKVATTPLDEDTSKWSSQILQALFQALPDAAEYNPQVVMLRQDEEQGFALGVVVMSSASDSALTSSPKQGNRRAIVPVVIKGNDLFPLDILMTQDRKMYPLTGGRLREALFRPTTFDSHTDDTNDQSLYSLFYPPGRSGNMPGSGFGMGGGMGGGEASYVYGPGMKTAADKSLVARIAPTLTQLELDTLGEKLAGLDYRSNPALLALMAKLAEFDGRLLRDGDADILLDKAAGMAGVDLTQVGWDAVNETYWIKRASRSLFSIERDDITRGELIKMAGGEELPDMVDQQGTVTVAEPTSNPAPMSTTEEKWEVIEKPGIYKVRSGGNEFVGWVIPSLLDFDGSRIPMAVFTNGAVAAIQGSIAGVRVADTGAALPNAQPKGTGLFYIASPGGLEATVPMKIIGSEAMMEGQDAYHAVTMTGQPVRVILVEGLRSMVPGGDGVHLPATARFMPLENEIPVPLVDDVEAVKQANMALPHVDIRHAGDVIGLTFHGLPGLESASPKLASIDDAVFVLVAGGMYPANAHAIIKKAAASMRTEAVYGLSDVRTVGPFMAEVSKTAKEMLAPTNALRHDLVKEASVLPDIQTVDSVLSLNYINPENVGSYIAKLPYLEKALNTVCELVLASRLGMSEIPEQAAARAARGLDETIQGLKGLAMRGDDTFANTPAT